MTKRVLPMRVRARKRYWLANGAAALILAVPTCGIALLIFPFTYMLDKRLAKAAYQREELDLPPAWYDGFSKWEFEKVNGKNDQANPTIREKIVTLDKAN